MTGGECRSSGRPRDKTRRAGPEAAAARLSERTCVRPILLGGALQMRGDLERARKRIYAELADTSIPTGTFQTRMLVTLCFMNWIAADLRRCGWLPNSTLNWARGIDPEPFESIFRFYEPRMTLAKVVVARGSADSREQAGRLLPRFIPQRSRNSEKWAVIWAVRLMWPRGFLAMVSPEG